MVRRRTLRKRRRMLSAKSDDEVPDPVSATIAAAVIGAGATLGSVALSRPKAPKIMDAPKAAKSPLAGDSTELKPGQKTNGIYTTPQGVLADPNTARGTLLGGYK